MPELPEVQTIVDDLNEKIIGRKIVSVWFDWPKMKPVGKAVGLKIERIARRGKNILMYLSKGFILLIHQKMTGHLLVGKWQIKGQKAIPIEPETLNEKVNGYIRFILTLDDSRMIGLSDLRKFAKVVFGPKEEIENLPELKKLGPDALNANFSFKEFAERVKSKKKSIYQVLMDQSVVSGIGNIYVNDILWEAKVHPFKMAGRLTDQELKKIFKAMRKILTLALKLRGTSTSDYRDTAGKPGAYTEQRLVYDREGMPCFNCGTKIKRLKKTGRSAYFCPKDQRITNFVRINE